MNATRAWRRIHVLSFCSPSGVKVGGHRCLPCVGRGRAGRPGAQRPQVEACACSLTCGVRNRDSSTSELPIGRRIRHAHVRSTLAQFRDHLLDQFVRRRQVVEGCGDWSSLLTLATRVPFGAVAMASISTSHSGWAKPATCGTMMAVGCSPPHLLRGGIADFDVLPGDDADARGAYDAAKARLRQRRRSQAPWRSSISSRWSPYVISPRGRAAAHAAGARTNLWSNSPVCHGTARSVSGACLRRTTPLPGTSERSNRTHQRSVV